MNFYSVDANILDAAQNKATSAEGALKRLAEDFIGERGQL
jgi:hypothetical protein